jgi:hypothetical protein
MLVGQFECFRWSNTYIFDGHGRQMAKVGHKSGGTTFSDGKRTRGTKRGEKKRNCYGGWSGIVVASVYTHGFPIITKSNHGPSSSTWTDFLTLTFEYDIAKGCVGCVSGADSDFGNVETTKVDATKSARFG